MLLRPSFDGQLEAAHEVICIQPYVHTLMHTFMPQVKKHDGPRLSPTHLSTQFQAF